MSASDENLCPDDLRKLAKETILHDLRRLWTEAKEASHRADTAKAQAVFTMRQITEFADRIRHGELTPYEALAILDPAHPEVEEWLALVNARQA